MIKKKILILFVSFCLHQQFLFHFMGSPTQPADIYAFLVVFVLPLNSAVNPILYTFTTSKYRNQILVRGWNKLTSRKWRQDGSGHTHTGSNQGII